ncbi:MULTISPECIES: CBS domain-containing protein [unclassified Sinorhizobium]|uniref:CBS domain-containing protein n=1 Tax=unclassified Sinorhizobium TaxID=2613772 RepID=UPI0024C3AFE2|nr:MULTISPECIES: CBS domain-containing protein [unclassified Sinorhizobium]MDK1373769.1 CBS domain-containing protein [Sinorhizobium sp. 6-70]MDK1478730.1 CBS domain-containing protein [Sinorhizobium sp. 6-117]
MSAETGRLADVSSFDPEGEKRVVVTGKPPTPVIEICQLLRDHRIGAVVIVDNDNHIEGIFTERDVVACIAENGIEALTQPVNTYMWRNVHSCQLDTTIGAAMDTMNRKRARHLPVEHDGKLAGIVSIGDVVKHQIRAMECEAEFIRSYIAG